MKHIALILAVVIFAFSFASCGDLTYYQNTGWRSVQENFYGDYYTPVFEKINEIAVGCDIDALCDGVYVTDDQFVVTVCDEKFVCRIGFVCEELWGVLNIQMYFFGNDEEKLADYSEYEKYINFADEISYFFAYDVDENIFEEISKYCIENDKTEVEKELHHDSMTGGIRYGMNLGSKEYTKIYNDYVVNSINAEQRKCNYYYFRGFLSENMDELV